MKTLAKSAFALAFAFAASSAIAQDTSTQVQITLPEGAQMVEVPGGSCGLYAIVILADGNQQVITAGGDVRPVAEDDVACLTELISG